MSNLSVVQQKSLLGAWIFFFFLSFPNKTSCLRWEMEGFLVQYTCLYCNDYKFFKRRVLILVLENRFSALGNLPGALTAEALEWEMRWREQLCADF